MNLQSYLIDSARRDPRHTAVIDPGVGELTYGELDRLSDQVRDRLTQMGVRRGDRVGLYIHKTADTVAALFGVLKCGAAYVPVDPLAPASRNAYIHADCAVKATIIEAGFVSAYRDELAKLGAAPTMIELPGAGGGAALRAALDELNKQSHAPAASTVDSDPDELAYILYTSGSTGRPKGVMLSHRNACCFVDWCSEVFEPTPADRFSSHAPFHFDLSILDIYVSIKHGAALVIVGEQVGKEPGGLAKLIADQRITMWYSAPSILALLAQHGALGQLDYSALRIVNFAGEVFPVVHLRSLQKQWPHPRYFNLYGPTETNVCTWYEVPGMTPDDRTEPYPIGKVCSHLSDRVVDAEGVDVKPGEQGELCIAGPSVLRGYWNLPEQTANAFLSGGGDRWYRTGDIVALDEAGDYRYLGRRDRMIKKRGYRVELGEIEACLYRHPSIREAAVIATPDEALGMRVTAHLSLAEAQRLSMIELKRFCSEHLPLYMIPDGFKFHTALPKTSTDKIDYQTLKTL